ncbi:hypothetical protein PISMIDRAFT_18621 [Pisolithus microcarpus 441]|uniref:Uncharacterized protein n=1 Tax=Pisolithus microcarpus 441 TaxID=765257 RepID=A0A0C9Y6Q3_9AGAM|nr:hypothetical protein PISMIDRAFT_18621 [Pisolithus microcarpus 441]
MEQLESALRTPVKIDLRSDFGSFFRVHSAFQTITSLTSFFVLCLCCDPLTPK